MKPCSPESGWDNSVSPTECTEQVFENSEKLTVAGKPEKSPECKALPDWW